METLQMAFNILNITRKCMQLKCSKTTIYCGILNKVFPLEIYYQPQSNSINSLLSFQSSENGHRIVQIEVFQPKNLFLGTERLRSRKRTTVSTKDKKLLTLTSSWYYMNLTQIFHTQNSISNFLVTKWNTIALYYLEMISSLYIFGG